MDEVERASREAHGPAVATLARVFGDLTLAVVLPDRSRGVARQPGSSVLNCETEQAVQHIMDGFSGLQVHLDVPEGIHALSDLGIRLVTLSNGSATVAEELLERAGLRDHFERLLSVEDAGVWKPAAGAYAYALEQCAVDAMDAMLVAAHSWDIDGAHRAGLGTAWVSRAGGRYPAHFEAPELQSESLTDLAEQLR